MFPIQVFSARFQEILEAMDGLCASAGGPEALEDLNAEFEDMLLALSDIRPAANGDGREELRDAADDLGAVADDYETLAGRAGMPDIAEPLARLRLAVSLLKENLGD